jgi:hypothetical protein
MNVRFLMESYIFRNQRNLLSRTGWPFLRSLLIAAVLFALPGLAKETLYRFDAVHISGDSLSVDFRIQDILDKETMAGLRKGMTIGIEYQVQIWKLRPKWVDQLAGERIIRMKVNYDTWEKQYQIQTKDADPVFLSEERAFQRCCTVRDCRLMSRDKVEPATRYMVTVRAVLEPMSLDNYQEIKRWLSGGVKEGSAAQTSGSTSGSGRSLKKTRNWLVGLVLNLTGFGERVCFVKSPPLSLGDQGPAFENEGK